MATPVSNKVVERTLRAILEHEGFSLSPPKAHGQNGVDIEATRGEETYHIEVIGYKKVGAVRAKDFFQGFFRAISRLNDGAERCVLALAHQAKRGLPRRAKVHEVGWQRIGAAFPELEIWLVDTNRNMYEPTRWGHWVENF